MYFFSNMRIKFKDDKIPRRGRGTKFMSDKIIENNQVTIMGEVASQFTFSHEVFGEGFYMVDVLVKRLSNSDDRIPLMISERLIDVHQDYTGEYIMVTGQFRSYNKLVDGKSKLMLTVFVRELLDDAPLKNPNSIVLTGYICKQPIYRTTPFNREIADLLIAVNRSYNKSDYIPCIAWGRNARFAKNLAVGEKIAISGRIQSREYQKKIADDDIRTLTAYEVSICKLSAYENAENFDVEEEFNLLGFNGSYQESTYID